MNANSIESCCGKKREDHRRILRAGGDEPETSLEDEFLANFRLLSSVGTAPICQHKPNPAREWRLDFAWPDLLVAVEIDGGTASGGAHVRPVGMMQDNEKRNWCRSRGWWVLQFDTLTISNTPGEMIAIVDEMLKTAQDRRTLYVAIPAEASIITA